MIITGYAGDSDSSKPSEKLMQLAVVVLSLSE